MEIRLSGKMQLELTSRADQACLVSPASRDLELPKQHYATGRIILIVIEARLREAVEY